MFSELSFLNVGIALGGIVGLILLLWCIVPFITLWCLDIPKEHKVKATICFIRAMVVDIFCALWGLTAFIAAPILAKRTPWEADQLTGWNQILWGNNVGINGDKFQWVWDDALGTGVPLPMPLEKEGPQAELAISLCYYCPGEHPRSPKARRTWLTRNRSSLLGVHLGRKYTEDKHEVFGDPEVGESKEGWRLTRTGDIYQLQTVKRFGSKRIFKQSWGNKVGVVRDTSYFKAPPVWRTIGFGTWRGVEQPAA